MKNLDTGILKINLSAIKMNWRFVKNFIGESVECAAVVKADAYGLGIEKIASALFDEGCRHFFVVTLQEGKQLRKILGDHAIIYLLSGLKANDLTSLELLKIIPVLYHFSAVKHWVEFCIERKQAFPCVIKLDTGMTRLGLGSSEVEEFIKFSEGKKEYINPVLLMSHMACADEIQHELNEKQLKNFESAIKKIAAAFPNAKYSLANSSATFLNKSYHFNMVRIGAALYGINPQLSKLNPLNSVITLSLPVLQNRLIERGCSIGYGATAKRESGSRLIVVAGGYADGIHRVLVGDAEGIIEGERVKLVGRISMDSCVFDITHCKNQQPDFVEIINDQLTLDALIQRNKNLGYEILTSLGTRFYRDYV